MPRQKIIDFLNGSIDIVSFRKMYDEQPEINAFLQKIIDDLKTVPDRFGRGRCFFILRLF